MHPDLYLTAFTQRQRELERARCHRERVERRAVQASAGPTGGLSRWRTVTVLWSRIGSRSAAPVIARGTRCCPAV